MKEKHTRQILKQRSIMDFMESNLILWHDVEAMRKNYDRFVRNIKRINDLENELNKNPGSLKTDIEKDRGRLIEALFPIVNVLYVYAREAGKNRIMKITDVSISEIKAKKNNNLIKLSDKLLNESKKLIVRKNKGDKKKTGRKGEMWSVADHYGLTRVHIDNMQDILKSFTEKVKDLSNYQAERNKAKRSLKKKVEENETILSGRIDKIMTVFLPGNIEFFNEYQEIRKKSKF